MGLGREYSYASAHRELTRIQYARDFGGKLEGRDWDGNTKRNARKEGNRFRRQYGWVAGDARAE